MTARVLETESAQYFSSCDDISISYGICLIQWQLQPWSTVLTLYGQQYNSYVATSL